MLAVGYDNESKMIYFYDSDYPEEGVMLWVDPKNPKTIVDELNRLIECYVGD